jgi:hypothetical protein
VQKCVCVCRLSIILSIVSYDDTVKVCYMLYSDSKLMGEELSGLTIRDLQFFQSQIEMSLQSVRKKKVTSLNIICGTMSP